MFKAFDEVLVKENFMPYMDNTLGFANDSLMLLTVNKSYWEVKNTFKQ